jgi:glycosyltransferase involved in cell wall biosynthesis
MEAPNNPKVSVCVVTWNQEKYIRQCLQSIVDQQTDFPFEVIVGDDCSTDSTRAIVREFADKYPTIVKPLFHETNLGPTPNYLAVHEFASGEYVAHLDGDDWALPGKLQIQADCLDSNPDVSLAVHAVKVCGKDKTIGTDAQYPTRGSIEDLLKYGTYFVHSSVMYRKKHEFAHSHDVELVDYYLYLERASKGCIYLDRRILGCYREHEEGISQNMQSRAWLERCYERAFDRALELGVSNEVVQAARLKKRMIFAIARYLKNDLDGYKRGIRITKGEFGFASKRHLILHWTRLFPGLLGIYVRRRAMIKKLAG